MKVAIHTDTDGPALQTKLQACIERASSTLTVSGDDTAELLVVVGATALTAAAETDETRPIIAVGLGADTNRPESITSELTRRCAQLTSETAERLPTVPHRPLHVAVGSEQATAVCDCALLTTEPARISEYGVRSAGCDLAAFRSDGVVVATPLGSGGYTRAAGGPRLVPETGLAVVPIAPFATKAENWIVNPPVTVTVERDDDVTVYADQRPVAVGGSELAVELTVGEPLSLVTTQSSIEP